MADQTIQVKCGFFDAINGDRLYSADDMNLPYRNLVGNGVIANEDGSASTFFEVLASGSGVTVSAGNGVFGNKWFTADNTGFDVPANTSEHARIDTILAQVDTRTSGRCGNLVYRTGEPSATPTAPDINTVSGVIEYRIADITRPANSSTVLQSQIIDQRGSDWCPWIYRIIKQDTGYRYITLASGTTAGTTRPLVRKLDGVVHIVGDITTTGEEGDTIATLSAAYRPKYPHVYLAAGDPGQYSSPLPIIIQIGTDGAVTIVRGGTFTQNTVIYLDTSFIAN